MLYPLTSIVEGYNFAAALVEGGALVDGSASVNPGLTGLRSRCAHQHPEHEPISLLLLLLWPALVEGGVLVDVSTTV